jgi:uncharacterized protein with beta-barrel porin domain
MRDVLCTNRPSLRTLLATSSVAALLIGSGVPAAFAASCETVTGASGTVTNSIAITCINIQNATVSGNVVNTGSGTITATGNTPPTRTGITINNSTITGAVSNAGTISASGSGNAISVINNTTIESGIVDSGTILSSNHGIAIGSGSTVTKGNTAIRITGHTFTGGIANAGTVTGGNFGIVASGVTLFSGGINNSGTISGTADYGIELVNVATFLNGITNSSGGLITGGEFAINIEGKTFSGGITNFGVISGGFTAVDIGSLSTFSGGISNAGTISSPGHNAIDVTSVARFGTSDGGGITNSGALVGGRGIAINPTGSSIQFGNASLGGGIVNSGTGKISATFTGIYVGSLSTFYGGIANSGTISGGSNGIYLASISTFFGGITNSGTISSSGGIGIHIGNVTTFSSFAVSTFAGNISNSGVISAQKDGIFITGSAQFGSNSAGGGIVNSGAISASTGAGIAVQSVSTFSGGISNSGTITAHTGIRLGSSSAAKAVSSFSGNISNSGKIIATTGIDIGNGVTFAAGATVVNSGTITATTAINVHSVAGAVTVDQNAGTITGAIKLSSTGDTLNVNGGSISGNITGPAAGGVISFTLGAGNTFTYNSNFTSFTAVDINSGTVVLNGNDSAITMSVFSGGILAGTGTLDPNLQIFSGGTLEPGTPGGFGTLTINGSVQFFSGSFYAIDIAPGSNNNSKAIATSATPGGNGTVVVTPQIGNYAAGTKYQILTTSNPLTGQFAGLTVNGSFTGTMALDYATNSPDDVDLDITTAGYTILSAPLYLNQNQKNVFNAINNAILQGDNLPGQITNLGNLSGPGLTNALTQLSGEVGTGAQTSAFQLMTDFMNLLSDPSSGGGGGSPAGGGASGFAPEQEASLPSDIAEAYNSVLRALAAQQTFDQRWSAWGSAYGGAAKLDGNAAVGSNAVNASDYGFAAGMDYRATPDSVYGFALAGGGTNWSVAQNLGTGRSDSFQIGVHDTTHWGPFYLSGALAFANHWITTNRIAVGDQLTASFQGQSYAARGEAGYRYAVPVTGQVIGVTPYAALQVQDFHTPSFSETDLSGGGFGLSFAAMNSTDTRSELGARFDNLQIVNNMPLVLRARVAWAHDWFSNQALGAVFQALPGSNFTVNGAAPPQNSALTTAAAELHINANWTAIAKFDGEFATTAQTYAGTGTLKYSW